jgi:hypothetical protein
MNQSHNKSKHLKIFPTSFLFECFNKQIMNHIIVITHHTIISRLAFVSVTIQLEANTLNFLTSHIMTNHNHKLLIEENRNQTSNSPNNTKSTKAVILASAANQKNNPVISIYLNNSFFSLVFSLF